MTFEEIGNTTERVLIKAESKDCVPCRTMAPLVEKITTEQGIQLIKVDVDKNPKLIAQLRVLGLPTLILMNNGKEIGRLRGSADENKIRRFLS